MGGQWGQVVVDTLLEDSDRPEGLADDVWARFVQKRAERILLEADVARLKVVMDDLQEHYQRFAEGTSAISSRFARSADERCGGWMEGAETLNVLAVRCDWIAELAVAPHRDTIRRDPVMELRDALENSALDLECVFKLKQGYVCPICACPTTRGTRTQIVLTANWE